MSAYLNEPEPKCTECGKYCGIERVSIKGIKYEVSECCNAPVVLRGLILEDRRPVNGAVYRPITR